MYHQSIKNIIEYKINKLGLLNSNNIKNDELIEYIIINYNNSSKNLIQDYIYDLLYNNVYFINIENMNTIKKIINYKFNKNIKNEEIINILNNIKNNIKNNI